MLKTFLNENQFILPSYQHYGGFGGFQDYGILGFQIKNKLIDVWRNNFVRNNIHEVEIPAIMPHAILKASGHVDRFTDYVVYDRDGICHRADHLAKKWFRENGMDDASNMVDSWDQSMLQEQMNKYKMLDCESIIVQKKNLMIEVSSNTMQLGMETDFLRPELAQGIFVNFGNYLTYLQSNDSQFNSFGIAQIGKSYRKEISPQSFVRLREFTQAEIEYFVDPNKKTHPDYEIYKNIILPLLTDEMQEKGTEQPVKVGANDAVNQKLISHQLMAYFLAKIYLFAKQIGLKDDKIRFRQHQKNEMAHYASQCWDLECLVGGSWLECVGCADRGCYDLTAHSARNPTQPLCARRYLDVPVKKVLYSIKPNIPKWPKDLMKYMDQIKNYFTKLDNGELFKFNEDLFANNGMQLLIKNSAITFTPLSTEEQVLNNLNTNCQALWFCTPDMFTVSHKNTTITYETFIPHVVEPSFGIDRLTYAVLEQNIWPRTGDDRRLVLSLADDLTIYDVAVFPLHKKEKMIKLADQIRSAVVMGGFKCYTDDSGVAIGKRYVRCDEIGVRNVITVDPGTLETGMVTIRDRDTMEQIIVHMDLVVDKLQSQQTF